MVYQDLQQRIKDLQSMLDNARNIFLSGKTLNLLAIVLLVSELSNMVTKYTAARPNATLSPLNISLKEILKNLGALENLLMAKHFENNPKAR